MPRPAKAKAKRSATTKPQKRATKTAGSKRVKLAKADGDAPVKTYIASLAGWQREVAQRFDSLIGREVPEVRRAVKWSSPMYGIEGRGWFASFGAFKNHVKLTFFMGSKLKPMPPAGSSENMRSLDLGQEDRFDEQLIGDWVRQAAKLPGWGK